MKARINGHKMAPASFAAAVALTKEIKAESGVEARFFHLMDLRASQINGCAYCLDTHIKEARADGMGQQWIDLVAAWRESPVYDAAERAVLGWIESLTLVSKTGAADADFDPLKAHFTDQQIAGLTLHAGAINFWNRVMIALRVQHPVDKKPA